MISDNPVSAIRFPTAPPINICIPPSLTTKEDVGMTYVLEGTQDGGGSHSSWTNLNEHSAQGFIALSDLKEREIGCYISTV